MVAHGKFWLNRTVEVPLPNSTIVRAPCCTRSLWIARYACSPKLQLDVNFNEFLSCFMSRFNRRAQIVTKPTPNESKSEGLGLAGANLPTRNSSGKRTVC